jgi:O-antigen/teichoic acid export membrane protein
MNVLYLASFPHLVRLHEQQQGEQARELLERNAQTMLLMAACASSFFATMAPDLALIIRNPELAGDASRLMPVIACAIALAGLKSYALDVVFQLHQRTRDTLLITLLMALANVVLNLGLVPHYGASAAAWSALVAFGLGAAISYYLGRRHWGMPALGGSAAKALAVATGAAAVGLATRDSAAQANWPALAVATASLLVWALSTIALALACDAGGLRGLMQRFSAHISGRRD